MQLLSAIIPPILYLIFLCYLFRIPYISDQTKVIESFILGMFMILPVSKFEAILDPLIQFPNSSFLETLFKNIFIVGLIEESSKFLICYFTIQGVLLLTKEYKLKMYVLSAVAGSIGFALLENIIYVFSGGYSTAIIRTFSSIPLHFSTAIILGTFVFIHSVKQNKKFIYYGLIIAICMHGFYNTYTIIYNQGVMFYGTYVIAWLYVFVSLLLYFVVLKLSRGENYEI